MPHELSVAEGVQFDSLADSTNAPRAAPCDLASLWPSLRQGRCTVVWDRCDRETASLLVSRRRVIHGRLLHEGTAEPQLDALERVLLGVQQKVIAYERRLAASSTATKLNRALISLGARGPVSKAPLLLILAVHAAAGRALVPALSRTLCVDGEDYELISAPRPEGCLASILTDSELIVAKLLIEGRTYCEISKLRGTSLRTVANQLVSVFKKLRVSGRAELVARVVTLPSSAQPRLASDAHRTN